MPSKKKTDQPAVNDAAFDDLAGDDVYEAVDDTEADLGANPADGTQDHADYLASLDDDQTEEAPAAEAVEEQPAAPAADPVVEAVVEVVGSRERIFKIGATRIQQDESTAHMTNEQVRDFLKKQYPEIANSTIRETKENGQPLVEFLPVAGRKG